MQNNIPNSHHKNLKSHFDFAHTKNHDFRNSKKTRFIHCIILRHDLAEIVACRSPEKRTRIWKLDRMINSSWSSERIFKRIVWAVGLPGKCAVMFTIKQGRHYKNQTLRIRNMHKSVSHRTAFAHTPKKKLV